MTKQPEVLSASTLIGDPVKNLRDEQLGTIEEIMLDLDTGRIAYAVLSVGGFMGVGDKFFAIPWKAFSVDPVNEALILDVPKIRLEKAPGFDKNNWPEKVSRRWISEMHAYYGVEPYWN